MHLITIIISATQTRVVINVNIIIAAQILQLQKPAAAYLLLCPALPILLLNPKKKCNYTFYVKLKSTFFKPPYFQGTVLPTILNRHYI